MVRALLTSMLDWRAWQEKKEKAEKEDEPQDMGRPISTSMVERNYGRTLLASLAALTDASCSTSAGSTEEKPKNRSTPSPMGPSEAHVSSDPIGLLNLWVIRSHKRERGVLGLGPGGTDQKRTKKPIHLRWDLQMECVWK